MWSIRTQTTVFTVAVGCWCFHLIKATPITRRSETSRCDDICEYSAWVSHAYCGERNLRKLPSECWDVRTLDVRLNLISELHPEAFSSFPNLKYVYLVGNNLSVIERGAFQGSDGVEYVSMGHNNFDVLTAEMVEGLTNLKYLLVPDSNLRMIQRAAFKHNPILATLDVSGNKLVSPPCDAFPQGHILTDLYLTDNLIHILPSSCFNSFGKLKRLRINNNPIREIENTTAFQGLDSLEELQMSNTSLSAIPVRIFSYVNTIITLILSHNVVESLEERDFPSLPELRNLNLEFNLIVRIHHRAFDGLANLEILVLSNNRISSIGPGAFLPMERSLRELHLHGNKIQSIHTISSSIMSLERMLIAENPLVCSCNLSTLRTWLDEHPAVHNSSEGNATCLLSNGSNVEILETSTTHNCPSLVYPSTFMPKVTIASRQPVTTNTEQEMPVVFVYSTAKHIALGKDWLTPAIPLLTSCGIVTWGVIALIIYLCRRGRHQQLVKNEITNVAPSAADLQAETSSLVNEDPYATIPEPTDVKPQGHYITRLGDKGKLTESPTNNNNLEPLECYNMDSKDQKGTSFE